MVYVGTCGYSYKDWIGPVYPEGTKDSLMLEYYSTEFDFVEVNSSFYHMPRRQLFESIAKRTPNSFKTAVKLFQGFTHLEAPDVGMAEGFIDAIRPMTEGGRLICLLAQFPYSFHYTEKNVDRIKQISQWFQDIPVNVEFRNREWIRKDVMDLLASENLGYVCVDEPKLKGLIGKVSASTSQISYLRMHGRNAAKWYGSEGMERYDYLYDRSELSEWLPEIIGFGKSSSVTVISFNNHPKGKAVENARLMKELLLNTGQGIPSFRP